MIDFHCHLDLFPEPALVADQCVMRNVRVLAVTTAPSAWRLSRDMLERDGFVRVALGLHPQIAHERYREVELFESAISEAKYVGEIGLDFSSEFQSHRQLQVNVFNDLLEITERAGGRVISIHSRLSASAVLDCISKFRNVGLPVLHWFSGSMDELTRAIQLGCWFSVGPAMLNSRRGREIAASIPHDCILTETDGPFATNRGIPLLPWDVEPAITGLSRLWRIPTSEVSFQLADNFRSMKAAMQT